MKNLGKLFSVMEAKSDEERSKAITKLSDKHRELIETSNVNASSLVKEEVAENILEGAEEVRCMRDVLADSTFEMPSSSYRFILHESGTDILPIVPPTGTYPTAKNESYREVSFNAQKRGQIATIEEELIENSMFDIVEMRLKDLGKKAENTLNQIAIDNVIGNAVANQNYSSSEPVSSIAEAIGTLKDNGMRPDTLIMTTKMERDMFSDPHFRYDYSGETGNFRNRELGGKILGLKPYLLTVSDSNGSWSNSIKGVVLDSSKTAGLGIKNDVTMEQFDEPRNDLLNLKVSAQWAVSEFFKAAVNLSS